MLKKVGLEAPFLLNDASPRFEAVTRRLDTTKPDAPLREAWGIASRTWGVAPVVDENGTPCGLVTGTSLFRLVNQLIGPNPKRQEGSLAEILEVPGASPVASPLTVTPATWLLEESQLQAAVRSLVVPSL